VNQQNSGRDVKLRGLAEDLVPVLAANAADVDQSGCFPVSAVEALRGSGLFGLSVPVEFGGLGGTLSDLSEVAQILASGCLSTAMIWAMHCQQVDSVVRYGTVRLCEDLLPRVAAGKAYIASVTTEPTGGGHLLSAQASLDQAGEELVMRRVAPIVTGGEYADGFLVTMKDSANASSNQVTLVYADRSQLDIEYRGQWNALGMRGTRSLGMTLSGQLPLHQIVGERGEYRTVAVQSMIPLAHIGWSACWLGGARARLADVVGLVRSPRRPKSLDPNSPLTASRLARVRVDLELVSAYLNSVVGEVIAHRAEGHSLDSPETQIHINTLKISAAELTFRAVDSLIELTGLSTGYSRDSAVPLERTFRDLRSATLNYSNDRLLTMNGSLSLLDRAVRLA